MRPIKDLTARDSALMLIDWLCT